MEDEYIVCNCWRFWKSHKTCWLAWTWSGNRKTRATILGHIQGGGNPTVNDRLMAVEFVTYVIDKLIDEDSNESLVIVYKNSNFEFVNYRICKQAKIFNQRKSTSKWQRIWWDNMGKSTSTINLKK